MYDSGFSTSSMEMRLQPQQWAARILDSAKAGDPVSLWQVNRALIITGDLPKTYHFWRDRNHEKPLQDPQR